MTCRKLPVCEYLRRHAPAALLCLGLGAAGCAGGHFNLSSRLSRGEQIAADARHESDRPASTERQAGSLARLLRLNREKQDEAAAPTESQSGRVFSALVDRRPQSAAGEDPFLNGDDAAGSATAPQPATASRNIARVTRQQLPTGEQAAPGTESQQPLSDDQLWKMLEAESAVAAVPAPSQVAAESPAAGADTPVWARHSGAATQGPAANHSDEYKTPAFAAHGRDSAGHASLSSTAEAPRADATESEHRLQVEALLMEAERNEQQGALQEAYHAAALAERIAGREHLVFSPQQEQPADVARRLVQKMQTTPQNDPFGEVAIHPLTGHDVFADTSLSAPPAAPVPQHPESPASADRSAIGPAVQTADSTRPAVQAAFPPAQEWRGVKANTPVSLAVVESDPLPFQRNPDAVQHAVLKSPAAETSQSLPQQLGAAGEPLWSGTPDQRASFPGPQLSGPALTREPQASAPSTVAPPPPLDVGAERRLSAEPRRNAAARPDRQGGDLTWWVLGAVVMFAAAVLVRIRRGRTASL